MYSLSACLKISYQSALNRINAWFAEASIILVLVKYQPLNCGFFNLVGERRVCQGKLCSSNVQTEKEFAVKVRFTVVLYYLQTLTTTCNVRDSLLWLSCHKNLLTLCNDVEHDLILYLDIVRL